MKISRYPLAWLSVCALAIPSVLSAQPSVYVIPPGENPGFTGPFDGLNPNELSQKVLVIPVVGSESPVASGSPLDPAKKKYFEDSMMKASDFWFENSYGKVSLAPKVLDKVYKLPRPFSDVFNAPYQKPTLQGSGIFASGAGSVLFPAGTFKVNVHLNALDQGSFSLTFLGTAPVSKDSLSKMIIAALAAGNLTDKVDWRFMDQSKVGAAASLFGSEGLEFSIADRHAEEGGNLRVDPSSTPALLDPLGFKPFVFTPTATGGLLRTQGLRYPVDYAAWRLEATLRNGAGQTQVFSWRESASPPSGRYPQFAGSLDQVLTNQPGVTIAQAADGELEFTFTPTIPLPLTGISIRVDQNIIATPSEIQFIRDSLGLDSMFVADGKATAGGSNMLKVDQNELIGQAIASYMLYELTTPGTPDIPELDITAANQAELVKRFQDYIDPYHTIVMAFIDPPNLEKRASAGGNYMNSGLINGAYKFIYQTGAANVMIFDFTDAKTMAHELGHNLGLPDLYNNQPGVYDPRLLFPGRWEVMDDQSKLSHAGLYCKEVLLKFLFNSGQTFPSVPAPVNLGETVTSKFVVTPQELPRDKYDLLLTGVPAGYTLNKGIRLPLGASAASQDYHFLTMEVRAPGEKFSLDLPQPRGGLYITDNILTRVMDPFLKPEARNFVHPLSDKGNVYPVPVLQLDLAAPEIDFTKTFPAYAGIALDIKDTLRGPPPFEDRLSYVVDVTRTQTDFMDLVITPWKAPPYESSDIWIEHGDKNPLGAAPIPGNGEPARWSAGYVQAANSAPLNWVRVQVTNTGNIPATKVQVLVKANTPAGMGDAGKWVSLPLSDAQDIPGKSSRIFNIPWNPGTNGHTCLKAEVFRWTNPEADNDPLNNATQENVFSFNPTSASPWTTMPFSFEVGNGFDYPILAEVQPRGVPEGYNVKLDKPFLSVPARSKAMVTGVVSMSTADIPFPPNQDPDDDYWQECLATEGGAPQCTRTWHLEAFMRAGDFKVPLGGVTYHSNPAPKPTVTRTITANSNGTITVTGRVTPVSDEPVKMDIAVKEPSGKVTWVTVTTNGNGNFGTTIDPGQAGPTEVSVSLPWDGVFAPVSTTPVTVQVCKPRNR